MKRLYYIILTALSIAALSWVLPWVVELCFPNPVTDPFVGYSPVNDRLIISTPMGKAARRKAQTDIRDIDPATGRPDRSYTEEQRDSLLPEIFANQLASKNMMPDSIKGVEMSMAAIRRNRWIFSSLPRNINRDVPRVYPLMESMPLRFDLEAPEVALCLAGRVEIIDISTNRPDTLKTRRFARMFADRGFRFPALEASANVTTRKAYDNGYLLIDANRDIFHLKMQASRPSMARIGCPDGATPSHVFVMENADRALYGLVATEERRLFAIARDDSYSLIELPGVSFDPEKQRISILKGLFAWTVKVSDDKAIHWTALSSDSLRLLGQYDYIYPADRLHAVTQWIFPFITTFTSADDSMVYPRISDFSWRAMGLNLLLAILLGALLRRSGNRLYGVEFAVTLLFGIFAFIPLILIKK